jgi:hypothetical protein
MPRHESSVPLRHMLDHAREAYELGQTRIDLVNTLNPIASSTLLSSVCWRSSARRQAGYRRGNALFTERALYREIPWSQIIGMRNRLIHSYDFVDFTILWQTITEDLPPLIAALENILSSEDER